MKKFSMFLLTAALLVSPAVGQACCGQFSLAGQVAAFFPLDSRVRDIYGTALPEFTLEANWQRECYGVWLNGSYVFGNGHATGCGGNKTHLNLVPVTFGVKYLYSFCDAATAYVGLGGCYNYFNTRDHSCFVHQRVSSNGFGAVVKTGAVYNFCNNLFFEGFFNYTYQRFTFCKTSNNPFVYRNDVNLSSLQLGAGFGIKF